MVRTLLEKAGINRTIEFYPQKRALAMTGAGENLIIYPILKTQGNSEDFLWISKISNIRVSLFGLKENKTPIIDTTRKVGVVRGSQISERLELNGFNNIVETDSVVQSIKMMQLKRIDYVAAEELVLIHDIENYNNSSKRQDAIYRDSLTNLMDLPVLPEEDGFYIAASKKMNAQLLESLTESTEEISRNGLVLEVAHWWTNPTEKPLLDLYKSYLSGRGYQWNDSSFAGGAGSNMEEILNIRRESGNFPQVLQSYMGPAMREWAKHGLLVPLNDIAAKEMWSSLLPPLINENLKYDGVYYAAPVNIQKVNLMWVNAGVFSRCSVSVPDTWDQFFPAADRIRKQGFIPLAMCREDWQVGTLFELLLLGLGGTDLYRRALIDMDPEAFRSGEMDEILKTFRRLRQYTDSGADGRTWVEAVNLIADGKAAMYLMGDWCKPVFQQSGTPFGEKGFDVFPSPGTRGIFLNNTDVFIFPRVENYSEEGQLTFASMIFNKQIQRDFNRMKGSLPSRNDVDISEYDEISKSFQRSFQSDLVLPSFNYHQTTDEERHDKITGILFRYFYSDSPASETAESLALAAEGRNLSTRSPE